MLNYYSDKAPATDWLSMKPWEWSLGTPRGPRASGSLPTLLFNYTHSLHKLSAGFADDEIAGVAAENLATVSALLA